jgi:hypothetical protein
MGKRGRLRDESGFTIVSGMTGGVLVAVSAVALATLYFFQRAQDQKLKRWSEGEEVLVNAAAELQAMSFAGLRGYCVAKGALGTTRPSVCVASNGKFAATGLEPGADSATGQPKFLEVLRNWKGEIVASGGNVCVELTTCEEGSAGHLLNVTLTGHWHDASKATEGKMALPKTLVFRKGR